MKSDLAVFSFRIVLLLGLTKVHKDFLLYFSYVSSSRSSLVLGFALGISILSKVLYQYLVFV